MLDFHLTFYTDYIHLSSAQQISPDSLGASPVVVFANVAGHCYHKLSLFSLSLFSMHCFSSTSVGPRKLVFSMPPYMDQTRRNMLKNKKKLGRQWVFFCFLRPAFGWGHLHQPKSLFGMHLNFDPARRIKSMGVVVLSNFLKLRQVFGVFF